MPDNDFPSFPIKDVKAEGTFKIIHAGMDNWFLELYVTKTGWTHTLKVTPSDLRDTNTIWNFINAVIYGMRGA